jgi:hypothetical protein
VPRASSTSLSEIARAPGSRSAWSREYGDLRNIQLDVSAISGSGKVLPFLEQIDNASGDVTVRSQ